jgi:hypothetical protein
MENETTQVFCAREQKETPHTLKIVSGEIVLTCTSNVGTEEEPTVCDRFLKFPSDISAEDLATALAKHKEANEGQLSVEQYEAKEAELIAALNTNATPPAEPGTPTSPGPESDFG